VPALPTATAAAAAAAGRTVISVQCQGRLGSNRAAATDVPGESEKN